MGPGTMESAIEGDVTLGLVYKKADIIIPNDSCHPTEQKLAAIRYFTNRVNNYSLDHTEKQTETNIVKQIINNNKFDTSI